MANSLRYSKRFFGVSTTVVIVVISLVLYAAFGKTSVTLSEDDVTEILTAQLPLKIEGEKFFQKYEVIISEIPFDFKSDNKIYFSISPEVKTSLGGASLKGEAIGVLDLRGSSFYFRADEVNFESFQLDKKTSIGVATATTVISNFASRYKGLLEGTGINLGDVVNKEEFTSFIQSETESLVVNALQKYPVYTIEGGLGFVVSNGVDEIKVSEDSITINFSIFKFTGNVLLLLILTFVFAGLLFTAPTWASGIVLGGFIIGG